MKIFNRTLNDGTEVDVSVSETELHENSADQLELLLEHRSYMARRRLAEAFSNEVKVNWPIDDRARIIKIGGKFDAIA